MEIGLFGEEIYDLVLYLIFSLCFFPLYHLTGQLFDNIVVSVFYYFHNDLDLLLCEIS